MNARRGSLTNAQVGQAIWDYKHGRSAKEIGADLGVSARMIHYHLKVRKVPLHRPRKKDQPQPEPQPPVTRSRLDEQPYTPPLVAPPGPGVSWVESALCRQVDPELFFPEKGGDPLATRAVRVCRQCPVRAQCLEYALTHEEYGVWGGLTERQRRRLLKKETAA